MKRSIKFLVFCFLINCFYANGQWNLKAGYDIGKYTIPSWPEQRNFHNLQRINIITEYVFMKNFLLSLNTGLDFHRINYFYDSRTSHPLLNISWEYIYIGQINVQSYRTGISFGYQFNLNSINRIDVKFSYEQYFINHFAIKENSRITNSYNVPASEIDDNEPISSINESYDLFTPTEIGYKNKFLSENRNTSFSLGYRYQFDYFFINPYFVFSPWNNGLIFSSGQNIFLFGLNLGYTFPEKNNSDE